MSFKIFFFNAVAAVLFFVAPAWAENDEQPGIWFPVGEKLTYQVYWGMFPVAETRVTSEWIDEGDRTLLAIRVTTKSYALLETIYPVDDFIESVVDPETFLPLRFSKRLSEGRYRLNEITTFDHDRRMASWKHLIKKDARDFAIEDDTRDLLSFMYFMRSRKLEPNRLYHQRLMADEKLYDLYINTRNYVNVNVSGFGNVRSLFIEPEAKFQGFFVRVGRLLVWISDDQRCLCVRAVAKAPVIGSIKLLLYKVEGPGNDAWIKAEKTSRPRQGETHAKGGDANEH
jgi:hypothetical protein